MKNKFFTKVYFNHAIGTSRLHAIVSNNQEIGQKLFDAGWTEEEDTDFSFEVLSDLNTITLANQEHFFLENIVKTIFLKQKKELLINYSEQFTLVMGSYANNGTENSYYALEINSDLLELFEVYGIKYSVDIKVAPGTHDGKTSYVSEDIGKIVGEATLKQFGKYYYVPIIIVYNENCEDYSPGLDFLNIKEEIQPDQEDLFQEEEPINFTVDNKTRFLAIAVDYDEEIRTTWGSLLFDSNKITEDQIKNKIDEISKICKEEIGYLDFEKIMKSINNEFPKDTVCLLGVDKQASFQMTYGEEKKGIVND